MPFRFGRPVPARVRYLALDLGTAFALMLGSACGTLTAPRDVPRDARPFTPPRAYAATWSELEACSGLRGDFSRVRFYEVDSLPDRAVGRTVDRSVYLVALFRESDAVVRHELMHALVQQRGHPTRYFRGACGDLLGAE